jgi:pyrroloquinoline quinone (PQQ) biosynthesis protein C
MTATMTHSEHLRFKLDLTSDPYARSTRRLWRHPRLTELFPLYLIRLYGLVRTGVPMMQAAVDRCRELPKTDAVAQALIAYFEEHIPEEADHDEWLLDDIASLGYDADAIRHEIPSPLIASVAGSQYYWIHHVHPVGLMGYIFLLEGNPPTADHVERIKVNTGLPESAFRCLMHHAIADVGHREELLAALDAMPLTEEQAGLVAISATWCQHLLSESLDEMIDLFEADNPEQPPA